MKQKYRKYTGLYMNRLENIFLNSLDVRTSINCRNSFHGAVKTTYREWLKMGKRSKRYSPMKQKRAERRSNLGFLETIALENFRKRMIEIEIDPYNDLLKNYLNFKPEVKVYPV